MRWLPPIAAAILVAIISATTQLGAIPRAIAIACVVASFAAALFLGRKDVRVHATVVAAIAAVTAAGQTPGGVVYGVLAGAFLLVCIACLRLSQRTAPAKLEKGRTAVIFGVTGVIVTVSVFTLPPLAARVERTVTGMFGVDLAQQTAFSASMQLGATHDMLQSDAIVARIDGPSPEYLRGAVYDEYNYSHWKMTPARRELAKVAASPGGSTHIELDKSAPTGSDLRWFVPPGACAFDHDVEADAFGVIRRVSGDRELRYSTSGCTPAPVLPPTPIDVRMMESTKAAETIASMAEQWTAGATTDRDKLKRIHHELAKYEYSLDVPRFAMVDPIVDFLTIHKAGHCEYFASAMVLMARSQNIPARVVGGFRTSEVNPITNQTIVRDRNAHAWVEAWYDGAWHAWDPTPASSGPSTARSVLDHVGDLASLAWARLTSIGLLGYALIGLGIIVILLVIRSIGNFVTRPRRRRTQRAMEKPLPCFEALTSALAAAGFERDESEPIESFAGRIPNLDIASALTTYAAFRYGGIGEEAAVVRAAERATKLTGTLKAAS